MVDKRSEVLTKDKSYVEKYYEVDFRDKAHKEAVVNYFDTIFFQDSWFTKNFSEHVEFRDYEKSSITIYNDYWVPKEPELIANGIRLVREKIKDNKLNKAKLNETKIPDKHHFNRAEFAGYENNTSIKIESFEKPAERLHLTGRKSTYFDQIATNIAVKEGQVLFGEPMRRLDSSPLGDGFKPKPLDESMLANSLGIACIFVLDDDDHTIIPRYRVPNRKRKQSTIGMNGKWHCSSSGVFESKDLNLGFSSSQPAAGPQKKTVPLAAIEKGIEREILAESGFKLDLDYRLEAVCFSREIPRGGKPQFFYRAILNRSKFRKVKDVMDALLDEENHKSEGWEYEDERLRTPEFHDLVKALQNDWHVKYFDKMSYEGIANVKFCRNQL